MAKSKTKKKFLFGGGTPDKGAHVTYQTDGNGRWWKRVSAKRCVEEVFLHGQCQGVKGHKGVHWSYDPAGCFCWDDNKKDPKEGGCSGSTPPSHKQYRSPVEMEEHHYSSHGGGWEEVTDKVLLARLEADEVLDDGASVIRPVTDKKVLEKMGKRLKDHEEKLSKSKKKDEK